MNQIHLCIGRIVLDSDILHTILNIDIQIYCPCEKKNILKKYLKKIEFVLAYVTPRPPISVHKKNQPIQSSRLGGKRENIYECLVLLLL